jgi:hypothetical protein
VVVTLYCSGNFVGEKVLLHAAPTACVNELPGGTDVDVVLDVEELVLLDEVELEVLELELDVEDELEDEELEDELDDEDELLLDELEDEELDDDELLLDEDEELELLEDEEVDPPPSVTSTAAKPTGGT